MKKHPVFWLICFSVLFILPGKLSGQDAVIGNTWTVFGPYRYLWYKHPDGLKQNKIPPFLTISGVRENARQVSPETGKLDLAAVFGKKVPGKSAYICIPVEAKKNCSLLMGVGADWSVDIRLDGKRVLSTLKDGNIAWPPSASDHPFTLELEKGKHLLTIAMIGGKGSQVLHLQKLDRMPEHPVQKKKAELFGKEQLSFLNQKKSVKNEQYELTRSADGLEFKADSGKAEEYRMTIPLELEPGQQYSLNWSAGTSTGKVPTFLVTEKADGSGTVYYAGKIETGMDQRRYFYIDNPRPYAHLVFSTPGRCGISELSLRKCLSKASSFADWRIQRYPARKQFDVLSREIVTPHFKFASELPGGKLNLFYILGYWNLRTAVELEQRFPFVFEGMFTNGAAGFPDDYWARTKDGKVCLRNQMEQLDKLKNCKCIYIDGCGASSITKEMSARIGKFVADGGGLVVNGFDIPYYPYKDGKREAALKAFHAKLAPIFNSARTAKPEETDFVRVSAAGKLSAEFVTYGKGRAVFLLDAQQVKGNTRLNFEIRSALVSKALLWASKQVPALSIAEAVCKDGKTELKFRNPDNRKYTVSTQWFNDRCEIQQNSAESRYALVRVLADSKVSDWDVVPCPPKSDRQIKEITRKLKGAVLSGKVNLNSKLKDGQVLELSMTDFFGNLWLKQQTKDHASNTVAFSVKVDQLPGFSGYLKAVIKDKSGRVLEYEEKPVYFAQPDRPEEPNFLLGFWGAPIANYPARLFYTEFKKQYDLGYLLCGYHTNQVFELAQMNIRACAAAAEGQTTFGKNNKVAGTKDAPERALCLTSPALKKKMNSIIVQKVKPLKGVGILSYFLDHEMHLLGFQRKAPPGTEFCFSPSCLKHLREFLKSEYKDLNQLNAAWKTSFRSWDDVRPVTLKEAVKSGQYPRWIDHRRNMDKVWSDTTRYRIRQVRKYDPAGIGYVQNLHSGYTTLDSFNGIDYEQLLDCEVGAGGIPEPYLGFIHKRNRHVNTQGGSMWPPAGCATDNVEQSSMRAARQIWQALLSKRYSCLYYSHSFKHGPVLFNDIFITYPDLTVSPESRALAEEIGKVNKGADRFMLTSEPDDSGISLFYSRASEHACTLWQKLHSRNPLVREMDPRRAQFNIFAPAIENTNRNFSAVTERQIRAGFLKEHETKLLILPMAQSMTKETADTIREFVRKGGTLVADIRPALSSRSGVFYEQGLLDDVFGVKQPLNWDYTPFKSDLNVKYQGKNIRLKDVFAGTALQLNGAVALQTVNNIPLFCENRYGKGRAILLNFYTEKPDFIELFKLISSDIQPLFRYKMEDVCWTTASGSVPLQAVSVEKQKVAHKDKSETEDAGERESLIFENETRPQLIRFQNGDAFILGFYAVKRGFALGEGTMNMTFEIEKTGHVYNLKNGKYLGFVKSWQEKMPLENVAVYAVLPFKTGAPKAAPVQVGKLPDGTVKITATVEIPGYTGTMNLPVYAQLYSPDGKLFPGYGKTFNTVKGKGEVSFRLPLNVPSGKWELRLQEAVGRQQTTVQFAK